MCVGPRACAAVTVCAAHPLSPRALLRGSAESGGTAAPKANNPRPTLVRGAPRPRMVRGACRALAPRFPALRAAPPTGGHASGAPSIVLPGGAACDQHAPCASRAAPPRRGRRAAPSALGALLGAALLVLLLRLALAAVRRRRRLPAAAADGGLPVARRRLPAVTAAGGGVGARGGWRAPRACRPAAPPRTFRTRPATRG